MAVGRITYKPQVSDRVAGSSIQLAKATSGQ